MVELVMPGCWGGVRRVPLREVSRVTGLPVEHAIDMLRYMKEPAKII